MDIRLREIAGGPAGTYFIVNDNSTVEEIATISNLRLIPINVEPGPVNTIVVFQRGDTAGLTSIFGKGLRKHEKQGNFSIKSCLKALESGPIAVINLRAFDSTLDKVGISGISSNKTIQEIEETPYQSVFNVNGLWTPKAKNIVNLLTTEHLLNFANIGKGNVSYFVTVSNSVETLTDQGNETLSNTELEIEDFPALTPDMKVGDTFVDVWIFNNTFNNNTVSTNQFYGHLFNEAGLINYGDLEALSLIKESGFNRKITGSLIPFLKNEFDENISIDTLVNAVYAETGLIAYINDDVLENETIDLGLPIINTLAKGYYDINGALINTGGLLSHRLQVEQAANVTIDITGNYSQSQLLTDKSIVKFTGDIFETSTETLTEFGNKVNIPYNIGVRAGDVLLFEDQDDQTLKEVTVNTLQFTGAEFNVPFNLPTNTTNFGSSLTATVPSIWPTESPAAGVVKYQLFRKLATDVNFTLLVDNFEEYSPTNKYEDTSVDQDENYHYTILTVGDTNTLSLYTQIYELKLDVDQTFLPTADVLPEIPSNTAKVVIVKESVATLSGNLNSVEFSRRLTPKQNSLGKLQFTSLSAYVPRIEQFTNGSATRQNEVLDVLNSPSVLRGLKNFNGIRYVIDAFKSFIEGSYKYQFGLLVKDLDTSNKFVRCIINEPFIEDLENSTNPLFKQTPNGVFDITFIETGGNPTFSTNFLSKFNIGADLCFWFGSGSVVEPNVEPIAAHVSNAFINKTFAWDVVANESGYLDGITSIEINPDDAERKSLEKFRWNPIIKIGSAFTIYGNATGIKTRSSLSQIHNSELLAYIKETLYNMSRTENFKKGLYDEYLRFETQVQSFMDALALQGAIEPNPIVICNATNNTAEISKQKIKLCRVEYTNINALDKVVFELDLN